MSKINYLYIINVNLPYGDYYSIFSSENNYDIQLNKNTLYTDSNILRSFRGMVFADPNIVKDPDDYWINDFKIYDKIEYKLTHNKLIPDNLYKAFSWLNEAISIYDSIYDDGYDEYEGFEQEEKDCKTIIKHIENANTEKLFRYWDSNILKESAFCCLTNRYIENKLLKIQHAEAILNEILKGLEIDSIKSFDSNIKEYELSHNTEIEDVRSYSKDKPLQKQKLRGGIGHWPIVIPVNNPNSIKEYKINLLFHIGMLVSEIRFILCELLDSIMEYKPFQSTHFNFLNFDRFEDALLAFKIRLIKERKKYTIENQKYSVSLIDIKKEKTEHTYDKDAILLSLSPNFKKQEKIKTLLNDIDEHYYISKSVKFPKRKLAIIAYILQHCELFNKMSYETFKQNICWYYGKENISMKPNKIKNEALQEYYKKEFVYKKYNIAIKRIQ